MKKDWENEAFDIGLTWMPTDYLSMFVDYAKSYRIPNVDELTYADEDLRPQKGYHLDAGIKFRFRDLFEISATYFMIRIEDEIYYGEDPKVGGYFNRNYDDDTLRRGVELSAKIYPTSGLTFWGNYSYTDAKFEGTDNKIPLVPESKGSVGMEWQIIRPLTLSVVGTFVGSMYDGNDQTNDQYRKLRSYSVVDMKLMYRYKNAEIFTGLNNVFNEIYSTAAYSEYAYPMPERNGYIGMKLEF
ncbi:MAG TPA: TonB-dependent receptor [Deltaproteobacteria bacterium]|nr:TonB-dependent receptor [Deltaproteobacteria bacterium]